MCGWQQQKQQKQQKQSFCCICYIASAAFAAACFSSLPDSRFSLSRQRLAICNSRNPVNPVSDFWLTLHLSLAVIEMGGGHRFHYPKWVWSPAGGWWAAAPNWRRNTAIYFVFMAAVSYVAYDFAEKNTVRQYVDIFTALTVLQIAYYPKPAPKVSHDAHH